MYLGGSPGNIGQISFYDAARGEAYRDFADPIAMTARSLVEGLFGILPNALKGELVIKPGFPVEWNKASISLPDISVDFRRAGKEDTYTIIPAFTKKLALKLFAKANGTGIKSVTLNGKNVAWENCTNTIEAPIIEIDADLKSRYEIKITWQGNEIAPVGIKDKYVNGENVDIQFPGAAIQNIYDPQNVFHQVEKNDDRLTATIQTAKGSHVVFVQLKQNDLLWWKALNMVVKDAVEIAASFKQSRNDLVFNVINNSDSVIKGNLIVNEGVNSIVKPMKLQPHEVYIQENVGVEHIIAGTNRVFFSWDDKSVYQDIINWNIDQPVTNAQTLDLKGSFNDKVSSIFKNQYLSPRPKTATLQLPTQGIGDWTHPLKTADIDDKGLRRSAGEKNLITIPQGISFSTPSDTSLSNILFTSQWDNYPKEATVPLTGKSSHAYLLMAGSTNPMQSRIVNGAVIITYTDNTADTLLLKNPETWWPIEQDYMDDGFAFTIDAARPVRIHLKTGLIVSEYDNSIETYNGKMIDGGAATVLDMPLNKTKILKELKLMTIANDVVIGLMAVTLAR
jgi:hypothetical protein